MKMKLLLFTALLFSICFLSCRDDDLSIEKIFVGKWKLISQGINESDMTLVDSKGIYPEFFSDGTIGYYDSTTGKSQITGNYKIQSKLLIYNYDKTYEQGRFEFKYEFSNNNNQLKETYVQGGNIPYILGVYPTIFIYQRIK